MELGRSSADPDQHRLSGSVRRRDQDQQTRVPGTSGHAGGGSKVGFRRQAGAIAVRYVLWQGWDRFPVVVECLGRRENVSPCGRPRGCLGPSWNRTEIREPTDDSRGTSVGRWCGRSQALGSNGPAWWSWRQATQAVSEPGGTPRRAWMQSKSLGRKVCGNTRRFRGIWLQARQRFWGRLRRTEAVNT